MNSKKSASVDTDALNKGTEFVDPSSLIPTPLVSVVMLAYNHGRYLADAIEGVINQVAEFPIELVIGEDCSSDDTLAVSLDYQRKHPDVIRIITSSTNVGMQQNFRRSIQACRGEFVAFCDGDDYWHVSDKLAAQVAHLRANPALAAVHSDFSHIVEIEGHWLGVPHFLSRFLGDVPTGNILDAIVERNFIQTCTMMIRGDIARSYFNLALPLQTYSVADWPLSIFASAQGDVGYIDRSLATYRKTPGSVTNQGFASDIARARDSMRMTSEFCRWARLSAQVELRAHRFAMLHILRISVRLGDSILFEEAAQWLMRHYPEAVPPATLVACRVLLAYQPIHKLYSSYAATRERKSLIAAYAQTPFPPLRRKAPNEN